MQIFTDRAANLTTEEERSLDLSVVPLYIQFPGEEVESASLEPDDLFERLKAMKPTIPTTALPSTGLLKEMYQKALEDNEEILSIHLSSGLSGTFQAAQMAARELRDAVVTPFDSMTLSGGQRFHVFAAALAAKAGWALHEILTHLDKMRQEIEVIYTLDTLEYLEHGGRIGRVQSLVSSLLNIKPLIHVDRSDGKYSTVDKARTLPRAVGMMVDHLRTLYGETPLWVTVLHGQMEQEARRLQSGLEDSLEVARTEIMRVTPVLGVHTGPGIVGVAAVPMELFSDLM